MAGSPATHAPFTWFAYENLGEPLLFPGSIPKAPDLLVKAEWTTLSQKYSCMERYPNSLLNTLKTKSKFHFANVRI